MPQDGFVALIFILGLYFAPAIVALARDVPSKWSVVVLNVFLGWTVIGWVVGACDGRSVGAASPRLRRRQSRRVRVRLATGDATRRERVPSCGNPSTPWALHAGVWWSKGATNEWKLDRRRPDLAEVQGRNSDRPAAADQTPNLRIDPAIVRPPDAPELALTTASSETPTSVASELERLADLHARGALSDDAV
jgi:hypothetical protein